MTFSYVADQNVSPGNANRLTASPSATQQWHWWYLATPAPAYVCTSVRVTAITDSDHITVAFFDPYTGLEIANSSKAIDLDDKTYVWRGLPSQIDYPVGTQLAVNNSGLLFFTDAWLQANQNVLWRQITFYHPELYHKYPYAEDGATLAAVGELLAALQKQNIDPFEQLAQFPKLTALIAQLSENKLPALAAARTEADAAEEESDQEVTAVLAVGVHENTAVVDAMCTGPHQFEKLAAWSNTGFYAAVLSCTNVPDFVEQVAAFVAANGPIDILDIVDHGTPGSILCGDECLFKHDGETFLVGKETATLLGPMLGDTGLLRLLGCKTGLDVPGRFLVLAVAKQLAGHRVVFATLDRVYYPKYFNEQDGFLLAREMLYSSYEALDVVAPDQVTRINNILYVDSILDN